MTIQPKEDRVRAVSNRIFMTISGKWFRAYSIVQHVGRKSGNEFRNPVSAYPLGDGFVIAVLYGADSNWVRNAFAAGHFDLQTKGEIHRLERPELVGPDRALRAHPYPIRRMLRTKNIQEYVWAHRAA